MVYWWKLLHVKGKVKVNISLFQVNPLTYVKMEFVYNLEEHWIRKTFQNFS